MHQIRSGGYVRLLVLLITCLLMVFLFWRMDLFSRYSNYTMNDTITSMSNSNNPDEPRPSYSFDNSLRVPFETLKTWNRQQLIEHAIAYARTSGTEMIPNIYDDVHVYVSNDEINVKLARGMKAYEYEGGRRIDPVTLEVDFYGKSGVTMGMTSEGDMKMTDEDKKVLEFVAKGLPEGANIWNLTIQNNPQSESYEARLDIDRTMGIYSVNKTTGEWKYLSNKHYAPRVEVPNAIKKELTN